MKISVGIVPLKNMVTTICLHASFGAFIFTAVAEMITELIRFEPKICICNGINWDFRRESASVMRDFLLTFPQICLCNGN